MVVIFEGMDNCLKDTSISILRNYFSAETHVIKYSSPPKDVVDKVSYQRRHFSDMFHMIESLESSGTRNLILNRSHLGEYVYSQIYRGYHANWVFELEEEFFYRQENPIKIIMVLLYDSNNERLRNRDDGKSLSHAEDIKLDKERSLFLEAFNKSNIRNKIKFDLSELPRVDENNIDTSVIINEILSVLNKD